MAIRLTFLSLLITGLVTNIGAAPTAPLPPRTAHSQLETGIYHIEVDSRSPSAADERDAINLCDALIAQIADEGDYEIMAWRKNQYETAEGSRFTGTSHSIVIWTAKSSKTYSEAYLKYMGKAVPDQNRSRNKKPTQQP